VAYAKEHGQLGFLKILNAGHFVPLDQPFVSLEMIRRVFHGFFFKGFGGQALSANDPDELKDGERCPICQDCDAITEKAVSAARIEDAASANQKNIAKNNVDENNVKNNVDNNNVDKNNVKNKTNDNVNTAKDVDDQYYDDDGVSMWLWICGSVVLMCLAFDVGRRGRAANRYDPVVMTNGVDGENHFIDDEDACLT
jgi:E3 ubiquitin-protein ligase DOA10